MTERSVLDSWKEIAAYLGRTGRTCRNWEKEYGLPVHRLDGSPRAHVFAYADEIDRWKEEMLREKPAASLEITLKFSLKMLFIPAAVGLLVLAGAVAVFFVTRGPHYYPHRIIVGTFENQTGDKSLEPVGRIAADWIAQCVSRAGIAELVEVPPGKSAPGTPEETERLRALARDTGAGTLVSGAYFLQGKTLSFHARVSDISNGKLAKALDPVGGAVDDPTKAIDLMRQKVLGALAEISDPRASPFLPLIGQPPTYEAYKEFMAGGDAFLRGDLARAIELSLNSAALDPSFKTPLLQAAFGYLNLGQYGAGEKLVGELDIAKESLSPADRPRLDWLKARYQGDLAGELRAARQRASTAKGAQSCYLLGYSANQNNCPREAVKAFSMIDPEGISIKGWVHYWEGLTFSLHMLGRYRTELKQARRGRRQYPESMGILYCELRALAALGRIEEIDRLIDQSLSVTLKTPLRPGLANIPARLMNDASREMRVHGFKKGSLLVADRAIRWMGERPDAERTGMDCRSIMAQAYYLAEKWPESQAAYEGLSKDDPENPSHLGMLGALAARRGEKKEALRISRQLEEIKTPYLWGSPTLHRARIASVLGEKETAVRLLREAISQGTVYWRLYEDMDLDPLRDYPPFKELIRPKG